MVKVLRPKALRAAMREGGGQRGPSGKGEPMPGAMLMHYVGDQWQWQPRQSVATVLHPDHIILMKSAPYTKTLAMVIPKQNIVRWGLVEIGSLAGRQPTADHSGAAFWTLAYGPVGAVVGSSLDAADAKRAAKAAQEPVLAIYYRVGEAEHAVFLKFLTARGREKAVEMLTTALVSEVQAESG